MLWSMPDTGVKLILVELEHVRGLTVLAVEPDGTATALVADEAICLFPTRSGLADFLASDVQHTLSGKTAGFDARVAELDGGVDLPLLSKGPEFWTTDYDELWWPCGVLCAARGISVDSNAFDPAALDAELTAGIRLRTDFEQPGYAEADYWLYRRIVPFTLVLPSGTGMSLADEDVVCGVVPRTSVRFLGETGTVWLFRDERDLSDAIADGLPDALAQERLWERDITGRPPHFRPQTVIDLSVLPELQPATDDTLVDALGVLENLLATLTGSRQLFRSPELRRLSLGEPPAALKPRHQRKAVQLLRELVAEVDAGITWR